MCKKTFKMSKNKVSFELQSGCSNSSNIREGSSYDIKLSRELYLVS